MLTTLSSLIAKNRSWALQCRDRNADYFAKDAEGQAPHSLWIGCSDSRVPAEVLTGSHPGELFVHRNIANMVMAEDDNLMSVLQYAIDYLRVANIVLCGHYGCGGVQAAVNLPQMALNDENSALSRRITRLRGDLAAHLPCGRTDVAPEENVARHAALVEANVLAQFAHLIRVEPVRNAWRRGAPLALHGCIYDLHSGHLQALITQQQEELSA
ncbi:carbonic anhydrase [Pantoea sp. 1.19]|uniref:carbonic anhydrase n=1 Tax=Pantoea sp. 1.19 TaxID=1925589 RepID=UPI0009488C54|nr:carbonic anhydrase [Pantoea sp. 1.19]